MKKTLLIIAVTVILIVGGVILYAGMNANSLVAQFKPQIERIASDTLGARVSLGEITTSIFPNTSLVIDEVSIGEKTSGEYLSLKNVTLHTALMPLLSKELHITTLSLDKPNVTLTRTAAGLKIPGIPKTKAAEAPPPSVGSERVTRATDSVMAINLEKIRISDGTVTFIDEPLKKTIPLVNLSLDTSVALAGSTATVKDLKIEGGLVSKDYPLSIKLPELTMNMADGVLTVPSISLGIVENVLEIKTALETKLPKGTADITGTARAVERYMPLLKDLGYDFTAFDVKGALTPHMKIAFGPGGSYSVHGTASMEGSLKGSPFTLTADPQIENQVLSVPKANINIFGGTIAAATTLNMASNPFTFSSQPTITGMQIDQAMNFLMPGNPAKLFGNLSKVTGSVKGSLGAGLMQSLNGNFSFHVTNGGLRGVNIPGMVLKAANNIPFLSGALYQYVGPEFKAALDTENTEFSNLTGSVSLNGGRMNLSGVKMTSGTYVLDANGSLGFDSSVDMNATISFSKEFSAALVRSAKDFEKVLSADGTLVIPLTIQGTLPKVIVIPNLSKVLEIAGKRVLKEKAVETIGKALGNKDAVKAWGSVLGF